MSLTLRHFWNARRSRKPFAMQDSSYFDLKTGIVTLQYPHQTLPVPDNGRYQLDCEIDDCIVCDKCAKICPVDCIDIEPIKSSEVISYTSDGSPVRLYAAKFDIDMAKCCFCGLCTTVCPTECLTMTNEYDFSVVDITQMNFGFSNLSAEQADKKRKLYEQFVAEKEELKKSQQSAVGSLQSAAGGVPLNSPQSTAHSQQPITDSTNKPKPTFKPNFKPAVKTVDSQQSTVNNPQPTEEAISQPKPAFRPSFKPVVKTVDSQQSTVNNPQPTEEAISQPKPAFKPSFKPVVKAAESTDNQEIIEEITVDSQQNQQPVEEVIDKPKPAFKPSFKPVVKTVDSQQSTVNNPQPTEEAISQPKPAFKPSFKPVVKTVDSQQVNNPQPTEEAISQPKPVFKPSFKPKLTEPTITENIEVANNTVQSSSTQDIPKSKPVFKPTLKITPKDK